MNITESQLEPDFDLIAKKKRFMRLCFVSDSISSAVSTRNKKYPFYEKDTIDSDKDEIKAFIWDYLHNLWPNEKQLDKEEMIAAILDLQSSCSTKFGSILHQQKMRLGVSQKMICLFAKYLWINGQLISSPPLIPYDGIVKTALKDPELKDWTVLDSMKDYQPILDAIHNVSNGSPAKWELKIWNDSLIGSNSLNMRREITLIFTRHKETGDCNSDALLQILDSVKPEVIFEELSHALHHEAYVDRTLNNLESVAIRKYLANHDVEHIPVDTFNRPENFDKEQDKLNRKLTGGVGYDFFQLKGLLDQLESIVHQYGFHYLNSEENEKTFAKLDLLKKGVLDKLDDENLYRIARLEKRIIENREDVILDNVYKYSKENHFSKGLMFIGSGHRKSIMKKIKEQNETEDTKINWKYFQDLMISSK
jgi:hypothetical protein